MRMFEVPFTVENVHGFDKQQELIEVSIPFPAGLVRSDACFCVCTQYDNAEMPFGSKVLSVWPDKSLRWLQVSFCLDLVANQKKLFRLLLAAEGSSEQSIEFDDDFKGELAISMNQAELKFEAGKFSPFQSLVLEDLTRFSSEVELVLASAQKLKPKTMSGKRKRMTGNKGFSYERLITEGFFVDETESKVDSLNWQSTLSVYPNSSLIKLDFTVWNSGAAQHPGGCWDLGDIGSLLIKSLSVNVNVKAGSSELKWCASPYKEWRSGGALRLLQSGSGGLGCDHLNVHKNSAGDVPSVYNGYQVHTGKDEGSCSSEAELGGRASPEFFLQGSRRHGLNVAIENFWQNFPKLVEFSSSDESSELRVDLFPVCDGSLHELQAGERKTHSLFFAISGEQETLNWVNQVSMVNVAPSWVSEANAMPFIVIDTALEDPLMPFIQQGVEGVASFEKKREIIDEFGWRNFGDVYADHEALYQKEGEPHFVSHYNNQYDAIYGFARQYLQTGDSRWFKLMDELACHVTDIDIYHTSKDRVEYNNGLFWHTDHYLDAQTCTHRTFSKHNNTSSTPGQTGGGPGSEHCYTMGLMYHYYLTGNEWSKSAVIELANWMVSIHDGADSLLAQTLSAKNNEVKKLLLLLKGGSPLPYRYPFTRGTGNFITALLDAFSVSGDLAKLARVESVIQDTLHPNDDISLRNLDNIEDTWSYVVLLQAVGKYLAVKESLEQYDKPYFYAKESLLHYIDWISSNEKPYLSRVEVLEFPNDTWVAQEMRKLSLLVIGAMYSFENRKHYLSRASEFLVYIVETLSESSESHLSRIQILLLQNYGPHLSCLSGKGFEDFDKSAAAQAVCAENFGEPAVASKRVLCLSIVAKLFKGLKGFSIKNEKTWIDTRRS